MRRDILSSINIYILKSLAEFKWFARIIVSGIAGALVLTGIGIVVMIAGNALGSPMQFVSDFFAHFGSKHTAAGFFAMTGSVGFILGLIVNRCFPKIQTRINLLAVWAIPLILGSWLLNAYIIRVAVPQKMKLVDYVGGSVKIHLAVPKGRKYCLVFVTQSNLVNKLSGRINILEGANVVTNLTIEPGQTMERCDFFHALTNYDMEINFDNVPPSSVSVWLHWLQTGKDKQE